MKPTISIPRPPLTFLAEGRQRKVYLSRTGKYVLKVPKDGYGELANAIEARDYEQNRFLGKEKLAKCRLIYTGERKDTICLLMEKLTPRLISSNLPEWTDYVDCHQVGDDKNGNLKAYDWANT